MFCFPPNATPGTRELLRRARTLIFAAASRIDPKFSAPHILNSPSVFPPPLADTQRPPLLASGCTVARTGSMMATWTGGFPFRDIWDTEEGVYDTVLFNNGYVFFFFVSVFVLL